MQIGDIEMAAVNVSAHKSMHADATTASDLALSVSRKMAMLVNVQALAMTLRKIHVITTLKIVRTRIQPNVRIASLLVHTVSSKNI